MTIAHLPANPAHHRFRTGARPTPRYKIAAALTAGRLRLHAPLRAPRGQAAWLPKQMSMWLNDQDGDCVSAEAAANIAGYSATVLGQGGEIFIPDSSVLAFCDRFGVLNGADLLSVCQDMESTGMLGPDGATYWKEGVPAAVDLSHELALQTALDGGQVKLGIMSSALPNGAGNQNGWTAFAPGLQGQEDHCVGCSAYGPAEWMEALWQSMYGVKVDLTGAPPTLYGVYTWKTQGLVSYSWITAAAAEAYSRTPPVLNLPQPGPAPTPGPGPTPPPTPTPPQPQPLYTTTVPRDVRQGGIFLVAAKQATPQGSQVQVFAPAGGPPPPSGASDLPGSPGQHPWVRWALGVIEEYGPVIAVPMIEAAITAAPMPPAVKAALLALIHQYKPAA